MSKSFFINLQICIDRPAKVWYNGRRRHCRLRFGTSFLHFGARDLAFALHFCTSVHGDIRHFITLALWRRACEIRHLFRHLSLYLKGDICPIKGDICPLWISLWIVGITCPLSNYLGNLRVWQSMTLLAFNRLSTGRDCPVFRKWNRTQIHNSSNIRQPQ